MNSYQVFVISLLLICVPSISDAQDTCVELAKTIVYNQNRSFSLEEQRSINRAQLCIEQYKKDGSSRSAQIEASYKFFSAGVSGNESQIREEQARQCENKFGDFWSTSIKSNEARIASTDSLAVINECIRLTAKGMRPAMSMTSDGKEFALTLDWNPPVPSDLKIDHAGPRSFNGYKCSAQSGPALNRSFKEINSTADVRTTVQTGTSFILSCERPIVERVVDGETLTCYGETLLTIATGGPQAVLKISQSCSPSMPGRRAAALEERLQKAEERLVQLTSSETLTTGRVSTLSNDLNQLRDTVKLFAAEVIVDTNELTTLRANCNGGDLACLAGAHRACANRGYIGGVPQEWGDKTWLLCVGKK